MSEPTSHDPVEHVPEPVEAPKINPEDADVKTITKGGQFLDQPNGDDDGEPA